MMLRKEARAQVRGGFTLMELMVVVAILVVLIGASVPIYMNYLNDARVARAKADVKVLTEICETFKLKYGDYPATLEVLTQPMPAALAYIEPQGLIDPWGHEYQYAPVGQHNAATGKPDIWSLGPNINDPTTIVGNWSALQGAGGQ
jgi:general secretion pathway protein G